MDSLVGLWFHSIKEGKVNWQGQVVREVGDGYYLLQLYEWVSGGLDDMKLVYVDDMTDWIFYDSDERMRERCKYAKSRKREKSKINN